MEATHALWGVVNLLSLAVEPPDQRGLEHMLRLIYERLEPATLALQGYRAQT
jgi:hypothetical protein